MAPVWGQEALLGSIGGEFGGHFEAPFHDFEAEHGSLKTCVLL